jgi:hypothetical protein
MRKLILAGACALAFLVPLGGCAEVQKIESLFSIATGNVVPPQAVVVAINAFDSIEAIATDYLNLPRCGTGPTICRDPAITAKAIPLIRAGRADRNGLKAALRANPGASISLVTVYNDLGNTTSALSALFASK